MKVQEEIGSTESVYIGAVIAVFCQHSLITNVKLTKVLISTNVKTGNIPLSYVLYIIR